MKKIIILAAMAVAGVASADFYIEMNAGYGFSSDYEHDSSGNTPLLADGEQALVQLIYAGDDGIANHYAENNNGSGTDYVLQDENTMYGDDVFVTSFLTDVADSSAGDYSEYALHDITIDEAYQGNGKVYARVFNAAKTEYYEQAIFQASDLDPSGTPPDTADKYYTDNGSVDGSTPTFVGLQASGDNYKVVAVPEPATFGLMGVAGLGLFLARKKARA